MIVNLRLGGGVLTCITRMLPQESNNVIFTTVLLVAFEVTSHAQI